MCQREGCDKPVRAKGWCINHYSTWHNQQKREQGEGYIDARRIGWTPEMYDDYWTWVKKELKIVQK